MTEREWEGVNFERNKFLFLRNQINPIATIKTLLLMKNLYSLLSLLLALFSFEAYSQVFNISSDGSWDTTRLCSGTLHDPGGPTANYGNYSNGYFVIDPPGNGAVSVTFTQFQLQTSGDYVYIYDGVGFGTSLGVFNGSALPNSGNAITSTSGAITIRFATNGWSTYPGFTMNWTSSASVLPTANFTVSNNNPAFGRNISFTNTATNGGQSLWHFGDGTTSAEVNPTHKYTTAGSHSAYLVETNCLGSDTSTFQTINVMAAPVYTVSPDSIYTSVACGNTVTETFDITHASGGTMFYDLEAVEAGINHFIFNEDFESGLGGFSLDPTAGSGFIVTTPTGNAATGNGNLEVSGYTNSYDGVVASFASAQPVEISYRINPNNASYTGMVSIGNSPEITSEDMFYAQTNVGGQLRVFTWFGTYYFNLNLNQWNLIEIKNIDWINHAHDLWINGSLAQANLSFNDINTNTVNEFHIWNSSSLSCGIDDVQLKSSIPNPITLVPATGVLSSSNSNTISVSTSTSGKIAGRYVYNIFVSTNASGADSLKVIPWVVDITGVASMNLDKNCLPFGAVYQNIGYKDSIRIINTDCDSLKISSITSTSADFTTLSALNIAPWDTAYLVVDFIPSQIKTYNDTLYLLNNDVDTAICLSAVSSGAPVITTDSLSYTRTFVGCLDSVPFSFDIINTGSSALNWSISSKGINSYFDDFENGFNSTLWQSHGSNAINGSCNVNSGSNSLNFNGSNRNATTNTLNLTAGDSIVFWVHPGNGGTGCENPDGSEEIRLEYSTNGFSWFWIGTVSSIPTTGQYYRFTCPVSGPVQLRLIQTSYSSSTIDNYSVDDFRIGKPGSDGNFIPTAAATNSNDTTTVSGYFNVAGLTSGVYQQTVVISSNDPVDSIYTFNVSINLVGIPNIVYPTICLDLDSVIVGLSTQDSVLIYNDGCDDLIISSLTTSSPEFTVLSSPATLLPGDSTYLQIEFTPTLPVGHKSDTLSIFSNDTVAKVCLTGYSIGAPVISTDSASYSRTFVGCVDSVPFSFDIINTGLSPLNWQIKSQGASSFFDDFENGFNSALWSSHGSNAITTTCNVNSGSYSLNFNGSNRNATTNMLNLNAGDSIVFWVQPGNGGTGCEDPDGSEVIRLEYSTNGSSWNWIGSVSSSPFNGQYYRYTCPVSGPVQLRLIQTLYSGSTIDNYSVDDFRIGDELITDGNFTPNPGTTLVNDTINVSGYFYTQGLASGTYQRSVTINSNDPQDSVYTFNIDITIIGDVEISADTLNCLNYTTVLQGATEQDTVWIINTGCDTLDINGTSNTLSEFTASTILPTRLAADDSLMLLVDFSPLTVGTFTDTLEVLNNDHSIFICLNGTSTGAPLLSLPGDSLVVEVNKCRIIHNEAYKVSNIGQGPLDYQLNIGSYVNSSKIPYNTAGAITDHTFRGTLQQVDTIEIKVIHNGDFATTGERCTMYINGSYYTTVYDNNLYQQNDTMIFTLSGFNATNYSVNDSITVSLYNTTSVSGIAGSFHQIDIRMVKNTNWVAVTGSNGGTLQANSSANHNLLFNAAGLTVGRYATSMTVPTNQVNNSIVTVPIIMYVISEEVAEFSDTCVSFPKTFIGDTARSQLVIYNTGCEPLSVSNILSTNSVFKFNPANGTVAVDDSLVINIEFQPTIPSNYSASLIVTNSDSTRIICLNGEGIAKPIAGFTSFEDNECLGKFLFQDTSLYAPTGWLWDFGDGNNSTNSSPTHFYQKPGTYKVTLRALNINGFDTISKMVTANPLFVDFVMSHDTVYADSLVSFTDTSINAASWTWDFDDGGNSSLQNPTHTFTSPGKYDVVLTVVGTGGCQKSETHPIIVLSNIGLNEYIRYKAIVDVFPNPTRGKFTLRLTEEAQAWVNDLEMIILDMSGKKLKHINHLQGNETDVDITGYKRGVYMIKLIKKGQVVTTKRLVLE